MPAISIDFSEPESMDFCNVCQIVLAILGATSVD